MKTKALISFMVTAKLVCAFVFAYMQIVGFLMQRLECLLQFDKKLAETIEEKDKEIADRDAKLNRLKQQMAESLKGNSW